MLRLLGARDNMFDTEANSRAAAQLATQILEDTDPADRHIRSWALVTLADANNILGQVEQSLKAYDEGFTTMADDPRLVSLTMMAMENRVVLQVGYSHSAKAIADAQTLCQAIEASGGLGSLTDAQRRLGLALYVGGQWDDAVSELDGLSDEWSPELPAESHAIMSIIAAHRGNAEAAAVELDLPARCLVTVPTPVARYSPRRYCNTSRTARSASPLHRSTRRSAGISPSTNASTGWPTVPEPPRSAATWLPQRPSPMRSGPGPTRPRRRSMTVC